MKILEDPNYLERYQGKYSEKKLWKKISSVAKRAGTKVLYPVLILYYVLMDKNTPLTHKAIILGALGYFILPIDLLPDGIPYIGYTDDFTALMTCIKAVNDCITPVIRQKAEQALADWLDVTDS